MRPIIVWFRRDLRTDDNAALVNAAMQHAPLLPIFIFDTRLIHDLSSDGAVFDFQAQALAELKENLLQLGGNLITRRGFAEEVHRALVRELRPAALYYNRDYEPSARERDLNVEQIYHEAGIETHSFKDVVVHEPDEVLSARGEPYIVFTPYARAWKNLPHPTPFTRPRRIASPSVSPERLLGARDLGKAITIPEPAFVGGEREAYRRWKKFLTSMISSYGVRRDLPSIDGTSRLSAYLRFGCISIRRMIEDCEQAIQRCAPADRVSVQKFMDELIWREFYVAVLYHFPRLSHSSYNMEFDSMPWRFNKKELVAWQGGKTGYPLVDAGMRQLNRTGWMHNRVRMVVASFLTKDLRYDWREGAAYFEKKLMDIETASNTGGWQWASSTGIDPNPLRIFNPRLQSERFDPDGEYIRQYVPELRRVPKKFIHAPHLMPFTLQQEIGCLIGKDYPGPVVDHAEAAGEYKRIFGALRSRNRMQR